MPYLDPSHPLTKLLKTDKRYKFEAYVFVFESLNYAHEVLNMGQEHTAEEEEEAEESGGKRKKKQKERHLTGQQLCMAAREYALDQYGLMAKAVLGSWGLRSTGDIGNVVFNLIEANQMRKTKQDRREDFDDVFDFETAFLQEYKITGPDQKSDSGKA
jgi:uncharacterized repeat protein (TIGR04138 family)